MKDDPILRRLGSSPDSYLSFSSLFYPLIRDAFDKRMKGRDKKRDKIDAFPLTAYLLSDEVKGMKA